MTDPLDSLISRVLGPPPSIVPEEPDDLDALIDGVLAPLDPLDRKRRQMAEAAEIAAAQAEGMQEPAGPRHGAAVIGEAAMRGMAGIAGAAGGLVEREAQAAKERALGRDPAVGAAALTAATGGMLPAPLAAALTRAEAPAMEPVISAAQEAQEVAPAVAEVYPRPEYAQDFWQGMATDPVKTLAVVSTENLPNLVATIGAAAVNPALGMGTAYALEAGNAYTEAKEAGATEEQARDISGWVGLGNMAFEYFPAGRLLKAMKGGTDQAKKRALGFMFKQSLSEFGTETLQESNQQIVQALETGKWPSFEEFVKRSGEAGVTGAVLGLAGGGAGAGAQPQVEEVMQPAPVRSVTSLSSGDESQPGPVAVAPPPVAPVAPQEVAAGGEPVLQPAPQGPAVAEVVPSPAVQPDRRQDLATRRRVAEMAPEEMRVALLTDDLTGLGNRRAYDEAQHPTVAAVDVDGLKWVNDMFGHVAGSELLRTLGGAIAAETQAGYRTGGDEFVVGGESQDEVDSVVQRVRQRLAGSQLEYTAPDGSAYRVPIEVSYGTGETLSVADQRLLADKAAREAAGQRGRRGEKPPGVVAVPAAGREAPGGAGAETGPAALTPLVPPPFETEGAVALAPQEQEVPRETPEAQAPEPAEAGQQQPVLASPPEARHPVVTGASNSAVTERGNEIEFDYAVVDARDLVTSNDDALRPNPAYPQDVQPRDRTRATSEAQVSSIQKKLNPDLLAASPRVSDGAPIIGEDRVVESGNARSIGIRRAYKEGGEPAQRYQGWVRENAGRFGVDAEAVGGIEQPVLVRVRRTPVDRADFAREANEGTVAVMSATERAASDASRLTPEMLDSISIPESGEVNWGANRSFVRAFASQVSPNEQGTLFDDRGQLSAEGERRIQNAVLARAYGDPDAVAKLAEHADNNVRNVGNALLREAPRFARLREGERSGLDLSKDIGAALRKLSGLRTEGTKIPDYLAQGELLGAEMTPEARELLRIFDANARSSAKISDILRRYADLGEGLGSPSQGGLFGTKKEPSKLDLLKEAEAPPQGKLLEMPDRAVRPVQAEASEAGFIGTGKPPAPPSAPGPKFTRPEAEAEFQEARKGIPTEGVVSRIKEGVADLYHRWTRVHRRIPAGKRFTRFQENLRLLEHAPDVATDWVALRLSDALHSLDDAQREVFDRKLLVDNLAGILDAYGPDTEIPFLEPSEVLAAQTAVDAAVAADPKVQKAVAAHRETFREAREELAAAYKKIDLDPEPLFKQGETYLHHQVLEYADQKRGLGARLKKPMGRSWQRAFKGSGLPFNLHYLQAQGKVLAEMRVATVMARERAKLEANYDIAPDVKKEAKEQGVEDWRKLIPEGYDIWQDRPGSVLFPATRIVEDVAEKILLDGVGQVTSDDLAKGLMVGGPRKQLVLPTEIVDTLNELNNRTPPALMSRLSRMATTSFKKVALFFPRRIVKYLFRNYVGDTQALTRSNPKALRRLGQAASELRTFLGEGKMPSPEFESWHYRGGLTANLRAQELTSTEKQRLARLARAGGRIDWKAIGKMVATDPVRGARQVWRRVIAGGSATRVYLESLNRYASYLEYLAQIRASKEGRPENFGASLPEEIMALEDVEDRAYWLSNQAQAAYDQVTEMGRMLRTHVVPFYSFQELAVRSNYRLLRNELAASPQASTGFAIKVFGKQALRRSPFLVLKAGKFLSLAYAFEAMMAAWNRLLFDEEDDDLPDEVRKQAHITFGRTPEGNVLYFNRLSVFEEVRDWFGIDEFGQGIMDYLDGRATAAEVAQRMVMQPIDKAVGAVTPLGPKGLGELLTGKSTFPKVAKPRDIEDRAEYVARTAGVEKEYRYLFGKPDPSRTYFRSWSDALLYTAEPGAAAYFDSLTYKRLYLRSVGKDNEGYSSGSKTIALRNMKRALRYKQEDVALKYLAEYVAIRQADKQGKKGKADMEAGIERSIASMDPLFGVKDEKGYRKFLSAEEEEKLDRALKYYADVLKAGDEFLKKPEAQKILSVGKPAVDTGNPYARAAS